MAEEKSKSLYDEEKRGSKPPDYTPAEITYRSARLNELQYSYMIREQGHMELNGMSYSEYYLINRQMDMAFNPPKTNIADSRIVSGLVHEKDQTIVSVIMDMNFQPKVVSLDQEDRDLMDICNVFTAKIKKSLLLDNFRDKLENAIRMLVSQGNVFATNKTYDKYCINKSTTGNTYDKIKWTTSYEKEYKYCTTEVFPNTGIFPSNIIENDLHKQPRMYYVMHYPVGQVAPIFKDNPRWDSVPKTPTRTVPVNIDGIWGDYYLQVPRDQYCEVICMESEIYNEYQIWVNGVQMLPVQEENGLITGYPLTELSPYGCYTMSKGDYERIPFFFFSKSNPAKNQVKEEEINEVMRLMVLMLRQKVNPPTGNNSTKVLQSNLYDPGMIISDLRKEDLSNLTPHNGINQSEFSFYKLLQDSVSESSVSPSVEGTNNEKITATQYIDQKKENLKKLGLSLDRTAEFLRQLYWTVLFNEIAIIDQKKKIYSTDGKFKEAYISFSVEDSVDGRKGMTMVQLTEDTSEIDPYAELKRAEEMDGPASIYHVKPTALKETLKRMKDKIYMQVVAEPDGEQQSLLAILFNLLTQYVNLKGGDNKKINFDYLETIISDNSGFDANKLFLAEPVQSPLLQNNVSQNQMINGSAQALATMK